MPHHIQADLFDYEPPEVTPPLPPCPGPSTCRPTPPPPLALTLTPTIGGLLDSRGAQHHPHEGRRHQHLPQVQRRGQVLPAHLQGHHVEGPLFRRLGSGSPGPRLCVCVVCDVSVSASRCGVCAVSPLWSPGVSAVLLPCRAAASVLPVKTGASFVVLRPVTCT